MFGPISSLCNRIKVDGEGTDLRASLLITLSWRISITPLMRTLPQDVVEATVEFEELYLSKQNGHVLTWQGDEGNMEGVEDLVNLKWYTCRIVSDGCTDVAY